jgi:hypothetical protein
VTRPAFGKADQELIKESGYRLIDEFGAIVRMEAPDDKGETSQHVFQYWRQVTLCYLLHRGYILPLRYLINSIDMIYTLLPIVVSLMDGIDSNVAGASSWRRSCPLANGHYCWFGLGISFGDAPIEVASPQIIEVGNRYPGDIPELNMPIN